MTLVVDSEKMVKNCQEIYFLSFVQEFVRLSTRGHRETLQMWITVVSKLELLDTQRAFVLENVCACELVREWVDTWVCVWVNGLVCVCVCQREREGESKSVFVSKLNCVTDKWVWMGRKQTQPRNTIEPPTHSSSFLSPLSLFLFSFFFCLVVPSSFFLFCLTKHYCRSFSKSLLNFDSYRSSNAHLCTSFK